MKVLFLIIAVIIGIVAFFAIANRRTRNNPLQLSREQVAKEIECFLNGGGGAYDWDDFLTFRIADSTLDAVRERCSQIDWNTDSGRDKLRAELRELRQGARLQ